MAKDVKDPEKYSQSSHEDDESKFPMDLVTENTDTQNADATNLSTYHSKENGVTENQGKNR